MSASLGAGLLLLALAQAPVQGPPPKGGLENPILSKQKEKEELVNKLRRDIFKVDRSLGETQRLIAKSRNAPYLPDLQFRLAELYVEKSRYVYFLQAETRTEGQKGAIVSPETKLLKQKAQQIYNRILKENPDFKDGDKVTFYLAHEQRELGEFDVMLKTLGDLVRKYPSSPLRLDSEQIIGDYWFDKADLKQAEEHFKAILDAPASPVHDLARYKMGWIRINQNNHADAVTFFEAAAASAPLPGVDVAKALNVKREALLDLVYSYTESRPAKGALQYFEKLSESRATYALALDKLGNRYFIKQQYEFAIPALRKLMEIQPDPELAVERAEKLYDSIKAAKNKVLPNREDVGFLVAAAVQTKVDPAKDESSRKKTLIELEEMARDLSTSVHVQAQKKEDKNLYLEAAACYERYLSLFRPKQYATVMMQNRADALFAAKQYQQAARQFEELALYLDRGSDKGDKEKKDADAKASDASKVDVAKDPKVAAAAAAPKAGAGAAKLAAVAAVSNSQSERTLGDVKSHDEALYGALLSHFYSLKPGEVERLNAFEVADARQALKLLGALFVSRYPKNEHVLEIKFNIARAYYEDGEYLKASELFRDYAIGFPENKDATTAGNLALDSLRQVNEFKLLKETGEALLKQPRLPAAFLADVKKIISESQGEAVAEKLLDMTQDTGDIVEALLKVAEENKGTEVGEKALYGAFTAARDKRNFPKQKEVGTKILADYPKGQFVSDVLLTLGRQAAEAGRFDDAANYYEEVGKRFQGDSTGLDGYLAAAKLRLARGDYAGGLKALEVAAEQAGARKAEVLSLIASTQMQQKQPLKAKSTAEQVLKLDKTNAAAAAIIAEVQATNSPNEKPDALIALMTNVANQPNAGGDDVAKGLWFTAEILYRNFKAIPFDKVEEKVAALQQLQGVYQQAATMGSNEWTVASLWRIANGIAHIVDVVEATPVPAGLKPADVEEFRSAIKQQSDPLRENAAQAYRSCLDRAEQLEVFSAAVVGCRNKTDTAASPLRDPPAPRAVNLDELQKKAETAQDAQAFEALGIAWLGAFQLKNASVNLTRSMELEDNKASVHSAMGYTLLLQGDPMGARAEYGRALEADPTFDKARLNLAAIKCRYADVEGAKRELSVIKDTAALAGPDVDPEWKACAK